MFAETSSFSICNDSIVLMANIQQKLTFQSCILVTITDADIGSLKSLHTLFDKYLGYMLVKFEQTRIIQNIQKFELFGKKVNHFEKVLPY